MNAGVPSFPAPLESPRRSRRGTIIVAFVAIVLAGTAAAWWQGRAGPERAGNAPAYAGAPLSDSSARAPADTRVRVRVINTTTTRGLARRATMLLRDFGYDVVDFDTDARRRRATTLIQVHTAQDDVPDRVRRVLGTGTVETVPDSLRYLDLTILLGRDWQPPSHPLRP
jgi:hypothetical protein